MTIPNKIVVATDFSPSSETAVSIACRMAQTFKVKVTLLHVFQYVQKRRYLFPTEWMVELIRDDVRRKLDGARCLLARSGIDAEIIVLEGKIPAPHILRFVHAYESPILALGTHSVGGMERFLLGSTAEEVLRRAECPVITTGPHVAFAAASQGVLRKVLFATDFSETSFAAIPFTLLLQRATQACLRMVHVSQVRTSEDAENRRFEGLRMSLQEAVDAEYITLHGSNISQAVVNEAERYSADLLVLGIKHAPEAVAHLAPKVASQIIAAAPCAVLAVSS